MMYDMKRIEGCSIATIKSYRIAIERFNRWLGHRKVTEQAVQEHFAWMREYYQPATIRVAKTALRKVLPMDGNFWNTIRTGRTPDRPSNKSFLSTRELNKVLSCMTDRQKLFVRFLYSTGLRVSEALNCKLEDSYSKGNAVYFTVNGKGDKLRESPPIDKKLLSDILEKYGSHSGGYIFQKQNGKPYTRQWAHLIMKQASEQAGIKLHPHALRHSIASALVNAGENLFSVADFLGHASINHTAKYYHGRIRLGTVSAITGKIK